MKRIATELCWFLAITFGNIKGETEPTLSRSEESPKNVEIASTLPMFIRVKIEKSCINLTVVSEIN